MVQGYLTTAEGGEEPYCYLTTLSLTSSLIIVRVRVRPDPKPDLELDHS